jgi:hypothetical protein
MHCYPPLLEIDLADFSEHTPRMSFWGVYVAKYMWVPNIYQHGGEEIFAGTPWRRHNCIHLPPSELPPPPGFPLLYYLYIY